MLNCSYLFYCAYAIESVSAEVLNDCGVVLFKDTPLVDGENR
uniref:Uncharacterized protein n=1 Tax=Anguilla anguilla TaxID=7936 RepID=A0A0E9VBD0_ANGAN